VSPVNEVVEFFSRAPSREDMVAFRLSPGAHDRLRDLLERNAAGMLSADEERELDQTILLDDILSLIRARTGQHGIHLSRVTTLPAALIDSGNRHPVWDKAVSRLARRGETWRGNSA
jgi:hypothetical protein